MGKESKWLETVLKTESKVFLIDAKSFKLEEVQKGTNGCAGKSGFSFCEMYFLKGKCIVK